MARVVQLNPGWLEDEGRAAREQFQARVRRLQGIGGEAFEGTGSHQPAGPNPLPDDGVPSSIAEGGT
jgi:hypothetical protein